jgi:prepilin-type N-terminal cleavage/methylation domain-containing protein
MLQGILDQMGSCQKRRRARLLRRVAQRGVTLTEVLIVVAIIAMVAGTVAVVAFPRFQKARVTNTETAARVIRSAVRDWQLETNESTCPTISQLVADHILDRGQSTTDAWNEPFVIECPEGEVVVTSAGPDKKKDTADDITVPKKKGAAEDG